MGEGGGGDQSFLREGPCREDEGDGALMVREGKG